MVTSALWTDFDNDNQTDLLITGEFMPVMFFKNRGGHLINHTKSLSFSQCMNGFWNSINGADIDNDGDIDYLLGNQGLNIRYKVLPNSPLTTFAADFDDNGSTDIITAYYENGNCYPTKQLRTLTPRINGLAKKYYRTTNFGFATVQQMFSANKIAAAQKLEACETGSGVLFNDGQGKFRFIKLPPQAQIAPVFGTLPYDINNDGNLDLLLVGNFYANEVEQGKLDALKGLVLLGDGKGNLKPLSLQESGFLVDGEARALSFSQAGDKTLFISCQNNDSLKVFSIATKPAASHNMRKKECYIGSGYLSQCPCIE
jgi:hypothetical protein